MYHKYRTIFEIKYQQKAEQKVFFMRKLALLPKILAPFAEHLVSTHGFCPHGLAIAFYTWLAIFIALSANLVRPHVEEATVHGHLRTSAVPAFVQQILRAHPWAARAKHGRRARSCRACA